MSRHPDDSPLAVIERGAQDRAKAIELDLSHPGSDATLLTLLRDEANRWQDDHRRGRRAHPIADLDRMIDRAFRNIARYGPLTSLLSDDDVWEVMVNAPGEIFVKRHRGPSGYHDEVFEDDAHVVRTLTKLLDDSSTSHRKLDPSEGLQDAQLDTGARLHIVHGDLTRGGHLMVNIRKFSGVGFTRLAELIDRDMLPAAAGDLLGRAVRARATIVIAGPPGAGKTTLLSCLAAELDPTLRVVVAEEVFEADIPLANVAQLQTRAARGDRPAIDLRRLVAGFLRMAPDVAIVGEVRDQEALPLLLTLSSGVQGFTTIHAGSARQALTRLRFISQLADTSSELPLSALNTLVSEAVDLVVQLDRTPRGPVVSEIVAVEDCLGGAEAHHFTTTTLFERQGPSAPLHWSGQISPRLAARFNRVGDDLPAALGTAPQ